MLKIIVKNNNVILKKPDGHYLSFTLSDKKMFNVLKLNVNKFGGECNFRLEKLSDKEIYIILDKNYKLLINDITLYEISSRMILLNNNITYPEYNFPDDENEINHQ